MLLLCNIPLFAQSNSVSTLMDKGNLLYDQGDYEAALVTYNAALEIDKNSDFANYEIANTYLALQKFQECVTYINKVLKTKNTLHNQAYLLKGTALDMMGKPTDALEVYYAGLKKFPEDFLLQYNTALTLYNQKQDDEAIEHVIAAIEANPKHKSSHLLLSQCMTFSNKRVQALMNMFYFLMLDNNSKRSGDAYIQLQKLFSQGVKSDGNNNISISLAHTEDKDEFQSADLMLSLTEAVKFEDKNKGKTKGELFYDQAKIFFELLGTIKQKRKSQPIWWNVYIPFFNSLVQSGNDEAFCYYISMKAADFSAADWMKNNVEKEAKLLNWIKKYQ